MLTYDRHVKPKTPPIGRTAPSRCVTRSWSFASVGLRLALAAALAAVLMAGGCGTVKDDAKRIGLENTLSSYRQAIRWGQFPAAAGFVAPDARSDLDLDALNNIRVTGYDVVRQGIIGPDDTAVQLVQIDYVIEDRQRLERLTDRQRWRYDAAYEAWWLESGLPDFVTGGAEGPR